MGIKRFREVDENNWDDFVKLFESKGAPSYCWCMAWRQLVDRQTAGNQDRKRAMKRIVDARTPVGILGYHGADPVAWCSIAARPTPRPLGGED